MVTVTIDVSEAKEMLGTMRTDGRRRFQAVTEWMRESARMTIEALLRAPPPGWASLMAGTFLLSGIQMMMLGIIGEYLGRLFLTVNGKPQSLVREVVPPAAEAETAFTAAIERSRVEPGPWVIVAKVAESPPTVKPPLDCVFIKQRFMAAIGAPEIATRGGGA